MIAIGQPIPSVTLFEYRDVEAEGCAIGPSPVDAALSAAGKSILLFALPGAYTPTCSAQHLPGYLEHCEAIKAKGIEEIWCVSVNDAFVMHAWGRDQGVKGRVRMLADGSGQLAGALGLTLDLSSRGMGVRLQRFAMVLKNGVVTDLQVEQPGKFELSKAEAMLARL